MVSVIVKLGNVVVNEVEFEAGPITVGRNADNDLRIENLAVSGHHARLEPEGNGYRIVDLKSTNGTFVNDQKVTAQALKDGDRVTVGKHTLTVRLGGKPAGATGGAPGGKAGVTPAELDQTMELDTRAQRHRQERDAEESRRRSGGPTGVLTVLQGAADRAVHEVDRDYLMIGKDPDAAVRLKGLLVPKVAAFVARDKGAHFLVPPEAGGTLRLNGVNVSERTRLKDGDTIEVRGAALRFSLRS